jgi:hypothetical protein
MTKEEIDKLYEEGKISAEEDYALQDKLRTGGTLPVNIKDFEIMKLYKNGELSISDTLLYKNNLLLERNRSNTSSIVWIIVINIILVVVGSLVIASNF